MSDFEKFMNQMKESSIKNISSPNVNLGEIQLALSKNIEKAIEPVQKISEEERQEFLQAVSSLIPNPSFISEFSHRMEEPRRDESEDEFVERAGKQLRQLLYEKFNIN